MAADHEHEFRPYKEMPGGSVAWVCACREVQWRDMEGGALPQRRRLGHAKLSTEPLNADDWSEVYTLTRGYQDAVRGIVLNARARPVLPTPTDGGDQ